MMFSASFGTTKLSPVTSKYGYGPWRRYREHSLSIAEFRRIQFVHDQQYVKRHDEFVVIDVEWIDDILPGNGSGFTLTVTVDVLA